MDTATHHHADALKGLQASLSKIEHTLNVAGVVAELLRGVSTPETLDAQRALSHEVCIGQDTLEEAQKWLDQLEAEARPAAA